MHKTLLNKSVSSKPTHARLADCV